MSSFANTTPSCICKYDAFVFCNHDAFVYSYDQTDYKGSHEIHNGCNLIKFII